MVEEIKIDCENPPKYTKSQICRLKNPNLPLFQHQDQCIEPLLHWISRTVVDYFIEATGDVFREVTKWEDPKLITKDYIAEKLYKKLYTIVDWNPEDERDKQRALTSETRLIYIKYGKRIRKWYEYVKLFPLCRGFERIRKVQLQSIILIMELIKWALDENTTLYIQAKIQKYIRYVNKLLDLEKYRRLYIKEEVLLNYREHFRKKVRKLNHLDVIYEMKKWMADPRQYRFYTKDDPEYSEGMGGNYNSPLWEFQDIFLEHTQPHPTNALYAVIMHLGDVFRGLCGNSRLMDYSKSKMREARRDVSFIDMERVAKQITPEIKLKLTQYRERNDLLIEYTQKFPRETLMPDTTNRKVIQIASLQAIKEVSNWTLAIDPAWDAEALKIHRRKVVELMWAFADKYTPIFKDQWRKENP